MDKRSFKKWFPLFALLTLIGGIYLSGLHNFISLEIIQQNKEALQSFTSAHLPVALTGFALLYITTVALSLPIASLLTLTGGLLFGKWLGTLIVVASATTGATIIFVISRTSLGTMLRGKLEKQNSGTVYRKIENNLRENAISYLLFMRFIPLFPFWLVNIVPALVNVPLRVFIVTTFFGIIPGSFVYVNVGEELGAIEELKDIISIDLLFAFALLGLFALLPALYKQIKRSKLAWPDLS